MKVSSFSWSVSAACCGFSSGNGRPFSAIFRYRGPAASSTELTKWSGSPPELLLELDEDDELLLDELPCVLDELLLELLGGGALEELLGGGALDELEGGGALEELLGGGVLEELLGGGALDELDGGRALDELLDGVALEELLGGGALEELLGGGLLDELLMASGG